MPKQKTYPLLSDAYRKAWESCAALWPLFILRFVFLILNFGTLFFCLFLVCWPLLQALWKGFRETGGQNFSRYMQSMDWSGYMPDSGSILMAIGLALLYITWWSLLAALFDGAVYSRMREHQEKGSLFSLREFFKDGIRYLFPMIGLQVLWSLVFLGVVLMGLLGGILAALLFHALSLVWLGILLAIPLFFVAIAVVIALAGFGLLAGAYLMEEKGIIFAMRQAFNKCLEGYGRVVWGILLVWVIYFVFSVAFQAVMNIFGLIPFIGFLFLLAQFGVNLFFSVAIWVYMPALAVVFSLEEEA